MNKIKTSKIATIFVMTLLLSSIMALTPMAKPAAAQLVSSGGSPTQGYLNTKGQFVAAIGGPLPSGVTPDITIPTKAYLAVTPDPVGVGQTILVNIWTVPGIDVARYRTGYTVTITKPDGTTDTVGPLNSFKGDGTAYFTYTVGQVGTWKFQFSYPGDYYPAGNYTENAGAFFLAIFGITTNTWTSFPQSMYYTPSSTPVTSITVQQAQVMSYPTSALPGPGDYWTRPIQPDNRAWWVIAGNYPAVGQLGGGADWPANTNPYQTSAYSFVPYVTGPTSAHIVWRMQTADSGLIGGTQGQTSLTGEFGGATPTVIYNGRCYMPVTIGSNSFLDCFNLQTGQLYWQIPNPIPTSSMFGMVFSSAVYLSYSSGYAETPGGSASSMGAGVSLVCLTPNLVDIDPFSGAITANITLPAYLSGTILVDAPYAFSIQTLGNPYYPFGGGSPPSYQLLNWSIAGTDPNFADRIVSNITWPLSSIPTTTDFQAGVAVNIAGISPSSETFNTVGTMLTAYSIRTGAMLWNTTTTNVMYSFVACADQGKVAVLMQNGGFWEAWNLDSGSIAWTSPEMNYPWGESAFGDYGCQSAYGLLYRESYDGVYAFNWTNGAIAWHFMAPSVPFETPYSGNMSFNMGATIADGMIYTFNTEHTPTEPITRGWSLWCINALTGAEIWNVTGSMSAGGVADGYLTAGNAYDGYTYVFGMGPSATTVSAPQTAITAGQSVTITGTVLDQSPGDLGSITNPAVRTDFPKTVPCVSDASMATYMDYLYMQAPINGIWGNATITGVPVVISAVAPNSATTPIATVTTDGTSGTFGYTWTAPTTPGLYKITATFAGDDSYSYSSATTYATVVAPTATATPTPTPTVTPPSNLANTTDLITYIAIAVIAIIVAIAIVGALILRKHA
jgi:hypothetical protein